MIKHLIFTVLTLTTFQLSAQTAVAPSNNSTNSQTSSNFSEEQQIEFYQQLQEGIKKSQDQYTQLKKVVDPSKSDDKQKNALLNAATALEVKYTLYKNFYNTPSVQNPLIRQKLTQLFQKNFITLDDLTDLKKMVVKEKTKSAVAPQTPSTRTETLNTTK